MKQPSPFAKAVEKTIREIARREGITLEQAAQRWMDEVHRRAEELRQQKRHDRI